MKIDPRFIQESGRDIYTGNELLVKGALETEGGVHLLTGYPGSPIAGFFDACQMIGPLLSEHGVVARLSANEALAVAMVNGVQMLDCRAVVAFKSVGMHVASDALALGVLAGTTEEGGAVVVCGDDPWSDSTQVPADSRYLAEHVRMPMLEPTCPQEVKDWIDVAFKLGRAGGIYIGYSMPVALADGGGTVGVRPNQFPSFNTKQRTTLSYVKDIEPKLDQFVLLPPRSWRREQGMADRHAAVCVEARNLGVNRIEHGPQKGEGAALGFVASGMGYAYLLQALDELGLTGRLPILKLGLSYPLDDQLVVDFAKQCRQIVVVEERRGFMETHIKAALTAARQRGEVDAEVWGKQFPGGHAGLPADRGLNPSIVIDRIVPLIQSHPTLPIEMTNGRLTDERDRIRRTGDVDFRLPLRTATFCPGCPHRDSSSVLLELRRDLLDPEYMQREHHRAPVDMVAHGDTGCYTMLMFEPTKALMHNYSGMGLGGATGSGVDLFIDNKQIVFMGDGTFYHSGQLAISQSIYTGQDITYIILDNKTTAMTGHQPNSGLELDLIGEEMNPEDIERIVRGMVPKKIESDVRVVRMDPSDRDAYRKMLEKTILSDGVKIVVADKECGITFHRRKRRERLAEQREQGFVEKQTFMNVSEEVCEFCLECTNQTGCPGLKIVDTDYGAKMQTDFSWCVNDGACARIDACPSFEEITIHRSQPARSGDEHVNLRDIPDPPRPIHADQAIWRCYLAGVGGMGIGTATAILVRAGQEMGYDVQFLDKKGLAIRNGGVYSQIVFSRGARSEVVTPSVPYGKADLLVGIDLLEAARSIDASLPYRVADSSLTASVVNTAKTPTILTLMGRDDFDVPALEQAVRGSSHPDRYFGFNVGDLCERVLDTKLYANIMMLGMAYQLGYLPVTLETMDAAIRDIVRNEAERNLRAFHIGRKIVVRPDLFVVEPTREIESARKAFRRKTNEVRARFGERPARGFKLVMKQTFRATRGLHIDDQLMRDAIIRTFDCMIWGGLKYSQAYCKRLVEIVRQDNAERGYRITRAVVQNLAKVMLIKDEVYVSAMLTSPEKYRKDQRRFNVNRSRGDRIEYAHHNRPEFDLFGHRFRFRWRSRDWQLRLMARMRFMRSVMPKWHRRERAFRDWYEQLVDRAGWTNDSEYEKWAKILSVPEAVNGYREVRYPKMDRARAEAQTLLAHSDDRDPPAEPRIVVSLSDRVLHESGT